MKASIYHITYLLLCVCILIACSNNEDKKNTKEVAINFGKEFYNWHFSKCFQYVTKESEDVLHFRASNVTETDIDSLRSSKNDATINLSDIRIVNDTVAIANIKVNNFYSSERIGNYGQRIDEEEITLNLKKKGQKWYVDLPR